MSAETDTRSHTCTTDDIVCEELRLVGFLHFSETLTFLQLNVRCRQCGRDATISGLGDQLDVESKYAIPQWAPVINLGDVFLQQVVDIAFEPELLQSFYHAEAYDAYSPDFGVDCVLLARSFSRGPGDAPSLFVKLSGACSEGVEEPGLVSLLRKGEPATVTVTNTEGGVISELSNSEEGHEQAENATSNALDAMGAVAQRLVELLCASRHEGPPGSAA